MSMGEPSAHSDICKLEASIAGSIDYHHAGRLVASAKWIDQPEEIKLKLDLPQQDR